MVNPGNVLSNSLHIPLRERATMIMSPKISILNFRLLINSQMAELIVRDRAYSKKL